MVVVAQLVRALVCGAGCRGFESHLPPILNKKVNGFPLAFFCVYSNVYFVYILYSEKLDKYYKGQTSNLKSRLERHNRGLETYTKKGTPWILVGFLTKSERSEAIILEKKLKNLNRKRLEDFIKKYMKGSSQGEN